MLNTNAWRKADASVRHQDLSRFTIGHTYLNYFLIKWTVSSRLLVFHISSTENLNKPDRNNVTFVLACGGHRCLNCNKCRDWYYAGDQAEWNWILRNEHWTQSDQNRWHGGSYDKNFKSRSGKTCTYGSVYENSDDLDGYRGRGDLFDFLHDLRLIFEQRQQRARRVLHKDICECPDNYRP